MHRVAIATSTPACTRRKTGLECFLCGHRMQLRSVQTVSIIFSPRSSTCREGWCGMVGGVAWCVVRCVVRCGAVLCGVVAPLETVTACLACLALQTSKPALRSRISKPLLSLSARFSEPVR